MSYFFRQIRLCLVGLLLVVSAQATDERVAAGTSAFEAKIGKGMPLVVKFGAPWCGACRAVKQKFEAVAQRLEKQAEFVEINVDQHPSIAKQYRVASLPTFIVFDKNGNEVARIVGNVTDLENHIKKALAVPKK